MGEPYLRSDWISGNLLFKERKSGYGEFQIGKWVSATVGSGQIISAVKTKALDVCVDDGNVALAAGSYQAVRMRSLIVHAIASGDVSIQGGLGHTKIVADISGATGYISGLRGYVELSSGNINVAAGVRGMIDVPSGSTITSVAAALQADSNDLGGTHTGKACAIHVPNPVAGTWDFFAIFGSATGCLSGATTRGADSNNLLIRIGSTTYKIPVYANS